MNQEQGAMPAVVNPTLSEMRKECSENPYTHAAAFIRKRHAGHHYQIGP
jgi:hypothetical protein